jgi:hypothetical protein
MKTIVSLRSAGMALLLLGAAGAACSAVTPGAPVSTDKVEVSYRNPDALTEVSRSNTRTDWLNDLSRYIARRAAGSVPEGERLLVTITDVQRAGQVEPWRRGGSDLRVVRDTTPPRIDLSFQLVAANGAVMTEGTPRLRDMAFMSRSLRHGSDPLAYEKKLIDDWMRKDIDPARR